MQHDEPGDILAATATDGSGAGGSSAAPAGVLAGEPPALPTEPLPAPRVRPLTRRRHVRVPGATAGGVERLAWHGGEVEPESTVAAVSVVPGASLPARAVPRPRPAGADLDALLAGEELGCRPGRHRRDSAAWALLRSVPGWRPSPPARDGDAEPVPTEPVHAEPVPAEPVGAEPVSAEPAHAHVAAAPELTTLELPVLDLPAPELPAPALPPAAPEVSPPAEPVLPATDLEDEIAAAAGLPVPPQRAAAQAPWFRRRRTPAPSLRAEIQAAGARLQGVSGQAGIARVAAEEAARLVTADVAALVLRTVEGPRILWLHPGGPESGDVWGPATLGALLGVGHPVRRVVEGDPLADGGATALLSVPVPSGGAIAGTLLARRHDPRAFTPVEQDLLSRLGRMTGAALLAAARRTAFERGELDDVTRLPGGRRLTGDVAAAVRTADRSGMPVGVLAAHVHGLARLRTDLGAPVADEVLGGLARALGAVLRVGDVAYRIGEDEFALLLPATDDAGVPAVRERLEAVAAEVFDALTLPGPARQLVFRTAVVPLDGVRAGADAVDAATRALELDRQKVRWTTGGAAS